MPDVFTKFRKSMELEKIEPSIPERLSDNIKRIIPNNYCANINLKNLSVKVVDHNSLIQAIEEARANAPTTINHASSRSHLILNLEVDNRSFTLVDLAGQEIGKTAAQNDYFTHKEAVQINLSLLSLKECIRAIANKSKHVPYRNSTLTMALKPMFKSDNLSAMICTLYPRFINQTIDTLKYASSLQNPNRIVVSRVSNIKDFQDYIDKNNLIKEKEDKLFKKACIDQIIPQTQLNKLLNDRLEIINKLKRRLHFGKAKLTPLKYNYKPSEKKISVNKPKLKPLKGRRKKWKNKSIL